MFMDKLFNYSNLFKSLNFYRIEKWKPSMFNSSRYCLYFETLVECQLFEAETVCNKCNARCSSTFYYASRDKDLTKRKNVIIITDK